MYATILTGKNPTSRRTLINLLPLKAPLTFNIFPTYACNFKCNYCLMSLPKQDRHFISSKRDMPLDLFKKVVDELKGFESRVKVFRFVGIGEPLMHPDIVEMVDYVNKQDVTECIEIITNGYLLTKTKADGLINAGLDRLVISLQGYTKEHYKRVSNVNIDFDNFVNRLRYVFDNRKMCYIYMKVVDTAIDNNEQEFYNFWGDMCDSIAVEYTVPIADGLDLTRRDRTQFGQEVKEIEVCPQPFYFMQINPDGNVVPCYSFDYPEIIGNVTTQSLKDLWIDNTFRHKVINKTCDKCKECSIIKYRFFKEDELKKEVVKRLYE